MGCCRIKLHVSGGTSARLRVGKQPDISWKDTEYIPYRTTDAPEYEGPYEVIPKLSEQSFATEGHVMREDLVVDGIPNYRTTNLGGGYTVIIAQD